MDFLYSYSLFPHELQPSVTANYGKLASSSIVLYLHPLLIRDMLVHNAKFKISIYSMNYNILRVFSGMAGLAFSN